MNRIKRIAGILWIIAGPLAIYYLVRTALHEISKKPIIDTKIQWVVFVIVFIPIAIGIIIFGYLALRGEYDHLPESSAEITD
jgi:purine-cytosine permease-like protein